MLLHELFSELLQAHDLALDCIDLLLGLLDLIDLSLFVPARFSQVFLSFDQERLTLYDEPSLLVSQTLNLDLIALNLLKVQAPFMSFLVFFNLIIPIKHFNFFLQFFKLLVDLNQHLLELFLLTLRLRHRLLHATDLLIKLCCASHLLEHF